MLGAAGMVASQQLRGISGDSFRGDIMPTSTSSTPRFSCSPYGGGTCVTNPSGTMTAAQCSATCYPTVSSSSSSVDPGPCNCMTPGGMNDVCQFQNTGVTCATSPGECAAKCLPFKSSSAPQCAAKTLPLPVFGYSDPNKSKMLSDKQANDNAKKACNDALANPANLAGVPACDAGCSGTNVVGVLTITSDSCSPKSPYKCTVIATCTLTKACTR